MDREAWRATGGLQSVGHNLKIEHARAAKWSRVSDVFVNGIVFLILL